MSASPTVTPLDRRLNAFRPDLADRRLEGKVEAERFVDGELFHVAVPVARVHQAPDGSSGMDTQFLHGDHVRVFERSNGWAWVQAERDGYVGYVPDSSIDEGPFQATHVVCVPRTFVYPEPELKKPASMTHSLGAQVRVVEEVETRGNRYGMLEDGRAIFLRHLRPIDSHADDYVSVAEMLIHTPYLWGGCSGFGIDCSGLVQLAMRMTGRTVIRDTDMQMTSIGTPLDSDLEELQRGDLVFWPGHVAIVTRPGEIVHANGFSMTVAIEPLDQAITRVEALYSRPIACRRP